MSNSRSSKIASCIIACIAILMTFVFVYPLYYSIMASFSNSNELMRYTGFLVKPIGFSVAAYKEVISNSLITNGLKNTFTIMVVSLIINMVLTSSAAYFFSRKDIMLKKALFMFVLITMFVNGGMVPFYLTVKGLGLDNTFWAVILPGAVNTFNLIILKTGFESIPDSLIEAAKVDGGNDFLVFFKIVLPLFKSTLAVIFLYYAVSNWNSWFYASIFLREKTLQPLQLILRQILLANNTDSMVGGASTNDAESFSESLKYAVICISTLPIMVIYPFLQKYFVSGIMTGAVKG